MMNKDYQNPRNGAFDRIIRRRRRKWTIHNITYIRS